MRRESTSQTCRNLNGLQLLLTGGRALLFFGLFPNKLPKIYDLCQKLRASTCNKFTCSSRRLSLRAAEQFRPEKLLCSPYSVSDY